MVGLASAYATVNNGKEPAFTNYAQTVRDDEVFVDTLDYFFTSPKNVTAVEVGAGRNPSLGNRESAREHCPLTRGSEHPSIVLSGRHPATFSIYADARYIDAVNVSKALPKSVDDIPGPLPTQDEPSDHLLVSAVFDINGADAGDAGAKL